ncbi:MAG: hypothetical protein JWM16_5051 [Verrucomicrobiales bacterium]|nr:hypothetical protein [Verrucomicrobiales bacterium]
MDLGTFESLTRVLQLSISPVALISGVGLLILSQTNRFGRVTDRLRELSHIRQEVPHNSEKVENQVRIFHLRARILRVAISSAVCCVLLASVLVLNLFVVAALNLQSSGPIVFWFALSLFCLICSLVLFLVDMHLSLKAIQEEMKR